MRPWVAAYFEAPLFLPSYFLIIFDDFVRFTQSVRALYLIEQYAGLVYSRNSLITLSNFWKSCNNSLTSHGPMCQRLRVDISLKHRGHGI